MTLPAWVPDIETKPAPMPLLLVQSFVNTWEGDTGVDVLSDPEAGSDWLDAAGLLRGPGVDLAQVRAIRENIRALLVHKSGEGDLKPADRVDLSALTARARVHLVLDDDVVELHPAEGDGLSFLAASLLLIIRDAQRDGSWARLKACRNPDCHWAYYDRSHAARGAWCDMAVCGNRMKNRTLRSRRSADAGPVPGQRTSAAATRPNGARIQPQRTATTTISDR
jgi:predicted RNA-binding Zn ribbon-like protein